MESRKRSALGNRGEESQGSSPMREMQSKKKKTLAASSFSQFPATKQSALMRLYDCVVVTVEISALDETSNVVRDTDPVKARELFAEDFANDSYGKGGRYISVAVLDDVDVNTLKAKIRDAGSDLLKVTDFWKVRVVDGAHRVYVLKLPDVPNLPPVVKAFLYFPKSGERMKQMDFIRIGALLNFADAQKKPMSECDNISVCQRVLSEVLGQSQAKDSPNASTLRKKVTGAALRAVIIEEEMLSLSERQILRYATIAAGLHSFPELESTVLSQIGDETLKLRVASNPNIWSARNKREADFTLFALSQFHQKNGKATDAELSKFAKRISQMCRRITDTIEARVPDVSRGFMLPVRCGSNGASTTSLSCFILEELKNIPFNIAVQAERRWIVKENTIVDYVIEHTEWPGDHPTVLAEDGNLPATLDSSAREQEEGDDDEAHPTGLYARKEQASRPAVLTSTRSTGANKPSHASGSTGRKVSTSSSSKPKRGVSKKKSASSKASKKAPRSAHADPDSDESSPEEDSAEEEESEEGETEQNEPVRGKERSKSTYLRNVNIGADIEQKPGYRVTNENPDEYGFFVSHRWDDGFAYHPPKDPENAWAWIDIHEDGTVYGEHPITKDEMHLFNDALGTKVELNASWKLAKRDSDFKNAFKASRGFPDCRKLFDVGNVNLEASLRSIGIHPPHRAHFVLDESDFVDVRARIVSHVLKKEHGGVVREEVSFGSLLASGHASFGLEMIFKAKRMELDEKGYIVFNSYAKDDGILSGHEQGSWREDRALDDYREFARLFEAIISDAPADGEDISNAESSPKHTRWHTICNQNNNEDRTSVGDPLDVRFSTLSQATNEFWEETEDGRKLLYSRTRLDVRVMLIAAYLGLCDDNRLSRDPSGSDSEDSNNEDDSIFVSNGIHAPYTGGRFLGTGKKCVSQLPHLDYEPAEQGEEWKPMDKPGYFAIVTGSEKTPLWILPGSHGHVFLKARKQRTVANQRALELIEIPPHSIFICRGDVVHAGAGYKECNGERLWRYHLYAARDNSPHADAIHLREMYYVPS